MAMTAESICIDGTYYLPIEKSVVGNKGCLTHILAKKIYPLASSKKEQEQLKENEKLCKEYWTSKSPLTTVYIGHAGVKSAFYSPVRNNCAVFPELNKKLILQYTVIESYGQKKDWINLNYIGGNLATASSMITPLHPYLASYHTRQKKERELPGLRIISWSVNDIFDDDWNQYLSTFKEAGKFTFCVLRFLKGQYGSINCHAHSDGVAFLAGALPHFNTVSDENTAPPVICLDRGFTSWQHASQNEFGCLSRLVYSVACYLGFKCDVVARVAQFCLKKQSASRLTLISTIRDHRFHGQANLCNNSTLQSLARDKYLTLLGVSPPDQILINEHSSHSIPVGHLLGRHCTIAIGPDCLEKDENFADKFLDQIFEKKERKTR